MNTIIVLMSLFGLIASDSQKQPEKFKEFIWFSPLTCEGSYSSNLTLLSVYQRIPNCDTTSGPPGRKNLIACSPTGEKSVIGLANLAAFFVDIAPLSLYEGLALALSGPLEGKWIYLKQVFVLESYLKKCSSVLGSSYVPDTYLTVLIADKIDQSVFLNPGGGYEPFKKLSSTICHGKGGYSV